ncbi:Methylamine utilisation protein MauE [Nannocystis exedens]|uniref:Methylamine utilisation protein MauE n=2 Tax=Nannocystis exedens TaxID=54 RepID=A0A1I1XKE8_9BACT|nr:Methylamine utilization protein MauE [Nannocystis exedens]SFE07772.1 Methylamine utilisation protein MauE [Nannocystis exedens]
MSQVQADMSDRATQWRRGGIWVLRLVVAGVLLAAAAPKLADPAAFAAKLPNYRLFPDVLVNVVATTAPMLELLAALALLSGRLYRGGVWLSVGLMATFTALIGSALARGIDLDCGCFGSAVQAEPVGALDLVRNIVLLGLTVVLALDLGRERAR